MGLFNALGRLFTVDDAPEITRDRLERLAAIVDRGLRSYAEAGKALAEIRDRQLYRNEAKTFDAFCQTRWNMTPQHAGRLIAAADLAQRLEPTGSIPRTESQARQIVALPEDEQLDAWQEAQQLAAGDPVRPEHVAAAVAKRQPGKKAKRQAKPIRMKVPGAVVVIEPGKAFTSAAEALRSALRQVDQREAA